MHTKVVICNCCIQKLSFAIAAYKSYRNFDAILRFLVWRVSMLNLSQSTLSTVYTIKCIQMKLEYNMRCLKPIGVAVPNLLCSDARYFVFGEETLNGGLVCLSIRLVFQQRGFEISSIEFSSMSKLILLDSLLQEVTMREIKIATYLIQTGLYFLIYSPRCLKFEYSISLGFKGHSS